MGQSGQGIGDEGGLRDDGRWRGPDTGDGSPWGGEDTTVRTSTPRARARAEVREMWRTRPARPRDDRKVAGVAAAIGRRYDVDPVLVRIGFVVAAFYGPGIPLYLAGCAALPDAGSAHRPGRRQGAALAASVLVAVAAVVSGIVLLGGDGRWFLPMLASLGLLLALHVTRGGAGVPADAGGADDDVTGPHRAPGRDTADAPAAAPLPAATTAAPAGPPAWDPLGAAPFAWDLPDPGPAPGPPQAPPSRLTPITLAVALVAAGIAAVLGLTAPGSLGVAAVPATALAVVGIGLVIGSLRHVGRWLIPFALVLAVATWLAAVIPWPDLRDGVGDIKVAPVTASTLDPEYRRGAGSISLDLRGLDLAGPPGAPVRTAARVGLGSIQVVVPRDADLVVRADAGLGDVSLDGRSSSGDSAALSLADPGPDGPGGRPIELDLHAGVGSLEVTRD